MKIRRLTLLVMLLSGMQLAACSSDDDNDQPADDNSGTPDNTGGDSTDNDDAAFSSIVDIDTDRANDLRGLVFAADGKLYASGYAGVEDALKTTVLARFNADGTLDTTFGDAGIASVDVAAGREEASLGVVELSNGDVLVSVNAVDEDGGQSVYLLRFDNTGTQVVSPGWGDEQGKVEVVFGWANADNAAYAGEDAPEDTAFDLLLDSSGGGERVVLFGYGAAKADSGRIDRDRFVMRLNAADGTPDNAFNGGQAFAYHSTADFNDNGRRGLVESDGSMLSVGYTNLGDGFANHVILFKLNADGTLDSNFGNFIVPESTGTELGLAAQPGVAVFNPFRVDGGFAEAYAASRQSDGSYVTTGYGRATGEDIPSTLGFLSAVQQDVVSFRVNGTALDTSWGIDGNQAFQSEGEEGRESYEERGRHMTILADDRTVQVGRFGGTAAVYVVGTDGQLDTSVDDDGIIELGHDSIASQFYAVASNADASRVAVSTNEDENGARLVVFDTSN
ncbi:delta-60 repeat domain-containing protein [Granulosicoccus sp. 3-233]|uniref:delta-60 repeat domain-containing protein n=1 Tax=Granulosicoccus sp. 3-233 TaxID=3417969 RepID=UPI003D328BD6